MPVYPIVKGQRQGQKWACLCNFNFLESTSGQFGKTYLIESVIISAFLLTNNSLFGIFNSSQSEFLSKAA